MAYDDRTVENALLSLKSMGLVRFVHPSHGGRTTRYRHSADERWKLSRPELAVLGVLIVRGPQTSGEVRSRAERHHPFGDLYEVEEVLDALAGRSPEPFVTRLGRRPGEREDRWAHLIAGAPDVTAEDSMAPAEGPLPTPSEARPAPAASRLETLEQELARLGRRVDRLERLLDRTEPDDGSEPAPA